LRTTALSRMGPEALRARPLETTTYEAYLAVIMDLYSRRIIGWAFAHHLGTELVAAALVMALMHRRPPQGLVHHSDRGVQYASDVYRNMLKALPPPRCRAIQLPPRCPDTIALYDQSPD